VKRPSLPNFFLVGAPRTGTTSLYGYLAAHPQVYMSPIKEPTYFARTLLTAQFFAHRRRPRLNFNAYLDRPVRETVHVAYVTQWEDYLRLFERVESQSAIGEASTFYLQCPAAPAEIHARIPDARIIIGLRNPVERAYSEYLMNYSIGFTCRSFIETVEDERSHGFPMGGVIAGSSYYEPVRRYLEIFGPSQVLVFLQEDLRNEAALQHRICEFLGIEHTDPAGPIERRNAALVPRAGPLNHLLYRSGLKELLARVLPEKLKEAAKRRYYTGHAVSALSDEDRRRVSAIFAGDLAQLQPLIGRDLSKWCQ
jgi:Sulfotransferase family